MDSLAQIFDQVINEASTGTVTIDGTPYNIKFNTLDKNNFSNCFANNVPTLIINDKNKLLTTIKKYLEVISQVRNNTLDEKFIKTYIAFLWCNASFDDFSNPISYVQRVIDFYLNKMEDCNYESAIGTIVTKSTLGSIYDETPYVFGALVSNGDEIYDLPNIKYGINNGECFIYAIQNKHQKMGKYQKQIKRLLYQINDNVNDEDTDESIKNVSVSAILSLTIFLKQLTNNNINKCRVVSFLPVRYNGRIRSSEKRLEYYGQGLNQDDYNALKEKMQSEQQDIQDNITQKFLRDFRRVNYHFNNVNITSDPFEVDEYMHLIIGQFDKGNNNLLNSVVVPSRHR